MTPEALQYLQRRLDDVRNLRLRLLAEGDLLYSSLASASGALEALQGLGLISQEELTEWYARFSEAITGEPFPNVPRQEEEIWSVTSPSPTVTEVAAALPGMEPLAQLMPPLRPFFQSIGFRRLIPGPNEEKALGPGVLRILALFEYGDGVEVNWLYSLPPDVDIFAAERNAVADDLSALPPDEQVRRLQNRDYTLRWAAQPHELALFDDVDTYYEPQGGGAGGGLVTMRGQHGFVPTLPPEATRVDVDADGVRFTVAVA